MRICLSFESFRYTRKTLGYGSRYSITTFVPQGSGDRGRQTDRSGKRGGPCGHTGGGCGDFGPPFVHLFVGFERPRLESPCSWWEVQTGGGLIYVTFTWSLRPGFLSGSTVFTTTTSTFGLDHVG